MSIIVPIQVLRGAAALAVAALHAQHEAQLYGAQTGRAFAPAALPWEAGVDVFFVISGFVMVYASRGLFGRPGARRRFLSHRIARVVPLYWATTSAYLALALAAPALLNGVAPTPVFVAASYLFVPLARPDGTVQPLYSLGWTLNYEMFFYLVFSRAIGWSREQAIVRVLGALALLAAVGLLVAPPPPLSVWTDPLLLEFGAGIVIGHLRSEGVGLGLPARVALALAALSLLLVQDAEPLAGLPRALAYGAPAACLVAACGLGFDDPWTSEGGPARRWGLAIGDASYALYLVHPFAIRGAREALRIAGLAPVVSPGAFLVLGLAAAIVAAFLVHRMVERPLTRAARRALERV